MKWIQKVSSSILTSGIMLLLTCAHMSPEAATIRGHKAYSGLNSGNKATVNRILEKIDEHPDKEYYYEKLTLLLNTPTVDIDPTFKRENNSRIDRAIKQVQEEREALPPKEQEDLSSLEEEYINMYREGWAAYAPEGEDSFFYINAYDHFNIMVFIKVRVLGEPQTVEKILYLEDAIEKHLSIPGFTVDLMFVDYDDKDVFTVMTDTGKWVTSHNWGGSHMAMAHELMHLMGLSDEYDGIEQHADNKNLSLATRLWYFENQIGAVRYPDATQGIMCYHNRKPLHRHACAVVGLGDECVNARNDYFNLGE